MTSHTELPEIPEQLKRLMANEIRNRRIALAIVAVVISGITMVVGLVVMGGAEEIIYTQGGGYSYWSTPRLEAGIFITLIGTVIMALSANFLTASWKKKLA